MTTADALLCSILSSPQDDLPRLVYADFLEESGDAARAELVRVQVELARLGVKPTCTNSGPRCTNPKCVAWIQSGGDELRRRERELLGVGWTEWSGLDLKRWHCNNLWPASPTPTPHHTYARGFVSSLACAWQDWLTHHERLYWHPKQTVECPKIQDGIISVNGMHYVKSKKHISQNTGDGWMTCPDCSGLVRIPRPFVNTAQPLESLRLTTWSDNDYRFDRVKCGTCDGVGRIETTQQGAPRLGTGYVSTCPDCNGTPPNRWTCDRWPGLVVEMPNVGT